MSLAATEILRQDGPIAAGLRNVGLEFEARPEQVEMAAAVETALAQRSRLIVEAGTGVGKSFAYLAPAIVRCIANGERVVVATNTIALQEQLVNKDVPLLAQTLDAWGLGENAHEKLKAVLVKGRGNYVSIRRLKQASERSLSIFPDEASRRSLHTVEQWAYDTLDGSLSTLPQLERPGIWDRVQSDSANCMGKRCPTFATCFYQSARRAMEGANLLVCNHALFFADLALRSRARGFLPPYDHVILDEAHAAEDVASEHFGLSVSEAKVLHLLGALDHARSQKGYLAHLAVQLTADDTIARAVESARVAAMTAADATHEFFENLREAHREVRGRGGRVPKDVSETIANPLTPALKALALRLKSVREIVTAEPDKLELNAYAGRADSIALELEALVNQALPGCVYWIEAGDEGDSISPRGRRGAPPVRLACAPIEVGPVLREHLFEVGRTVPVPPRAPSEDEEFPSGEDHEGPSVRPLGIILTSATLATRRIDKQDHPERAEAAFSHVMTRLGCDGAKAIQLDSPFEYSSQVRVFIDATMPDPRAGAAPPSASRRSGGDGADLFTRELSSRILRHITETGGGAFVLFTSFATLDRCADLLEEHLVERGIPLFVQNRSGPRSQILEEFKNHGDAALFGAASFWQGIDVRGKALRNVIITRLPFDPPDRPLTQARLERIQERGGNPFAEDSLPRAVIKFKQGFGRLIRSSRDRGRVVILDPRIVTARYGRVFLEALPPGIPVEVEE